MEEQIKEQVEEQVEEHAEASPSRVKRIILCPGSRRQEKKYGEESSTSYADKGSMLHEVIEARIYEDYNGQYDLVKTNKIKGYNNLIRDLTKEQITVTEECFDYFESVIRELQLTTQIISLQLETRVSLDHFDLPEVAGTADVIIVSENRVDVIDWKFGQGVPVFAEHNVQGICYAGGIFNSVLSTNNCPEINIHIAQPYLNYFQPWKTTGVEVTDWIIKTLTPAILESRLANAKCVPGDEQCRWCIVAKCETRNEHMKDIATDVFKAYTKPRPLTDWADDKDIVALLSQAKTLSFFIKELTGVIMNRCMTPQGFPGYKIVAGRSSRHWRDEQATQNYMDEHPEYDLELEDLFETKFVSVAKAEKLHKSIKKDNDFKELYHKVPGKPVLAIESDPRDSIVLNATSVFEKYKK